MVESEGMHSSTVVTSSAGGVAVQLSPARLVESEGMHSSTVVTSSAGGVRGDA